MSNTPERNIKYAVQVQEEEIVVRHEVGINVDTGYLTDVAEAILDGTEVISSGKVDWSKLNDGEKGAIGNFLFTAPYDYGGVADTLIGGEGLFGSPGAIADGVQELMLGTYKNLQEDLAEEERKLYEDSEFGDKSNTLPAGTKIRVGQERGGEVFELDEDYVAVDAEGKLLPVKDHLLLNVLDVRYRPRRLYQKDPQLVGDADAAAHYQENTDWVLDYEDEHMSRYARHAWGEHLLFSSMSGVACFSRIGKRLLDPPPELFTSPHPAWMAVPYAEDRTSWGDARAHSLEPAFFRYAFWFKEPADNPYGIPQFPAVQNELTEDGWLYSSALKSFWPAVRDYSDIQLGGKWVGADVYMKDTYIRYKQRKIEDGGGGGEKPTAGGIPGVIEEAEATLEKFGIRTRTKEGFIV